MSILKIKIYLSANYDRTNLCWTLTEGDSKHIKAEDTLLIKECIGWVDSPSEVTVSSINANSFVTSSAPPVEESVVSAVFIKEYALRDPMSLQWDISDLDSGEGSGTNQLGTTFRDRITTKRTLSCGWGPLSQSEMANLLSSMTDLFFYLEFPDALTGEIDEAEVYVSNRTAPLYRMAEGDIWKWTSMSVTFTER